MFDINSILGQAKEMQEKFKADLAKMAITASSGGGAVKVVVNGNKELTKIEFEPEALKDPEWLADMVLAAVSNAYAQVDRDAKTGLPGALNNLDVSALTEFFKK